MRKKKPKRASTKLRFFSGVGFGSCGVASALLTTEPAQVAVAVGLGTLGMICGWLLGPVVFSTILDGIDS